MKDIVLNGVSILELKEKIDKTHQKAAEFVSNAIEEATNALDTVLSGVSVEEAKRLLTLAQERLEEASTVSSVTGVQYYLPFNSEYGDPTYRNQLDDLGYSSEEGDEIGQLIHDDFSNLLNLLDSMESDSYMWHNSNCY